MLTLKVVPAFAASGSGVAEKDKEKRNNGMACIPNRLEIPRQQWPGTSPGNPGSKPK